MKANSLPTIEFIDIGTENCRLSLGEVVGKEVQQQKCGVMVCNVPAHCRRPSTVPVHPTGTPINSTRAPIITFSLKNAEPEPTLCWIRWHETQDLVISLVHHRVSRNLWMARLADKTSAKLEQDLIPLTSRLCRRGNHFLTILIAELGPKH